MKVGYFTMPLHPPGSNITETLESDLQQIILLDQLGYSEAWIGEHFTAQWAKSQSFYDRSPYSSIRSHGKRKV